MTGEGREEHTRFPLTPLISLIFIEISLPWVLNMWHIMSEILKVKTYMRYAAAASDLQ
jgi:hypothetical protein